MTFIQFRKLIVTHKNICSVMFRNFYNHSSLLISNSSAVPNYRFNVYNSFRFSKNLTITGRANYGSESLKRNEIDLAELKSLVKAKNIQLFDVRDRTEIEDGVIKSAVNIPLRELKQAFSMSPEEFRNVYKTRKPNIDDNNVIFYGYKEVKSLSACQIVLKLGYNKVRTFPGGWAKWRDEIKK